MPPASACGSSSSSSPLRPLPKTGLTAVLWPARFDGMTAW
jgi:hypothetical protein